MTSFIENPAVWEETKQELAETFGKEIPELFEKVWKACEKKLEANQKYYKAGESNYAVEILEEEFCIGVKNRYLIDFLTSIEDDNFELGFNDANLAFVVSSKELKTVIMPINL